MAYVKLRSIWRELSFPEIIASVDLKYEVQPLMHHQNSLKQYLFINVHGVQAINKQFRDFAHQKLLKTVEQKPKDPHSIVSLNTIKLCWNV